MKVPKQHSESRQSLLNLCVGPQVLPTLLKAIAVRKDAYLNLITIYQLDVKSAFLHGELSEEVFVEQPRGYEQKDNLHKVYKLKKALYGLKQAPRAWFSRIEAHFVNEGFERCHSEQTLFVKTNKGDVLKRFGMEESNYVHSPIVIGFKVFKDENGIKVDATFFKKIVGSLMYLTTTRPYLMFIIWDSMKKKYEGNERVKRSIIQALRKEFETLEMKSGEGVFDYFSRVMFVANKMRVHESKDIDLLSIDELQSSLIVHEQKFHRHKGEEQALKVIHEESVGGRGRGRGSSRGRGKDRGRQSFNKDTVKCYKCHKLGHFQYECPSWDKEANFSELGEEEVMLLMSYVEINEAKKEDVWFLDSGCSNHMCGDKTLFCDFNECFRQMVKLGNNSKMTVMGNGNKPACFHTTIEDLSHLWYCRYGHLSHKGLRTLQNNKMVNGLPQFEASKTVCTDCMVGTQHRNPIPKKSTWRACSKLQLIHADICGPITPILNSKKRYLISFIDDFSRKAWIYLLVEKSKALVIFKQYKSCVEKETSSYIKCLRINRGGEFTSQDFNEFCKENGIKRQLIVAYTPQQNGVAERKNRTIMNMVRSMLSKKKLPKTFWPEAVNWTVYILNRSPTLAVKNMTSGGSLEWSQAFS
uniref:Retrovirus-related Pol polyprotein from transposon TNT 1-94 n=1 Tax=Vitis vinifera TaxID=29760 RepID=A5B313_VITVI|nr:hypothetical protein VITISV_017862 [Vitis vinifera]